MEFKEDGTYVEKDVYNSSGSTNYYHGTWSYSGNKLTLIDTEEDNYTEVWTVTTMTENELVYELREKRKKTERHTNITNNTLLRDSSKTL
ncbi:lipocalin family protein [Bacteroides sp. CR5/BHMF/2]|nr:lipocalin family protein [Bacteroides sp. CR5/BHMF/2]